MTANFGASTWRFEHLQPGAAMAASSRMSASSERWSASFSTV
jgi:hypothetical protein